MSMSNTEKVPIFSQGCGEDGNKFDMNNKTGRTELYRPLSKMITKESEDTIVNTMKRVQAKIKDRQHLPGQECHLQAQVATHHVGR